jgi:histidine kinase/DNA gyrase B/HSP90-like ATPase
VGETRVDLLHLLEDLRDAYAGSLEETILTEIVANSLDSGAAEIRITADPGAATLDVVDDGRGMSRNELRRYHDLGASSKIRGRGIGFAGVGIKLGLLACHEVVTETRRGKTHVATAWRLASRHRAPWSWTAPPGLVAVEGTGVRLCLQNGLSPLLDARFLERTLRRHFQPLFETAFDRVLVRVYPSGVTFVLNARAIARGEIGPDAASLAVRVGRQRTPSAVGYMQRKPAALADDEQGVAVTTRGKVIKRGWDWLGVAPAAPGTVTGLIEVPALAECLTLNKADFIKTGPRGATYLAYRKAIQEAVTAHLAEWGETSASGVRRGAPRRLERDLQTVLDELASDFPLLATLVERRAGGQRRLPLGASRGTAPAAGLVALAGALGGEPPQPGAEGRPAPATQPPAQQQKERQPAGTAVPGDPGGAKRPAHHGLRIEYESRPGDEQLGRLVESTVWVNTAHPAYARATAVRADAYHVALTVAMALAPLAVEPTDAHGFVTTFLTRWGETGARNGRGPKRH